MSDKRPIISGAEAGVGALIVRVPISRHQPVRQTPAWRTEGGLQIGLLSSEIQTDMLIALLRSRYAPDNVLAKVETIGPLRRLSRQGAPVP